MVIKVPPAPISGSRLASLLVRMCKSVLECSQIQAAQSGEVGPQELTKAVASGMRVVNGPPVALEPFGGFMELEASDHRGERLQSVGRGRDRLEVDPVHDRQTGRGSGFMGVGQDETRKRHTRSVTLHPFKCELIARLVGNAVHELREETV